MADTSLSEHQEFPYILLIIGCQEIDSHWVRGFSTLDEARAVAKQKALEHEGVRNRILIIRGKIVQIGEDGD